MCQGSSELHRQRGTIPEAEPQGRGIKVRGKQGIVASLGLRAGDQLCSDESQQTASKCCCTQSWQNLVTPHSLGRKEPGLHCYSDRNVGDGSVWPPSTFHSAQNPGSMILTSWEEILSCRTKTEVGFWRWKPSVLPLAPGGHHMSEGKCAWEQSDDSSSAMNNFLLDALGHLL